ncbi:hypothetical protein [Fuchsiella alkaliacetigena]|uniref:hypothetical protein n=1 Tax=Fuchsiella alkaliacetigena TaxID=957042 RepID=UPI00200A13EF|nr:hypothetical protein [Fuchsiella alkaliacetigena]MCK8826087.1 hypothetical protein [Fuchsiella alkaliacetigena]
MAYKKIAKWDKDGEDEPLDLEDFCEKYKDKLKNWDNMTQSEKRLIKECLGA